MTRLLVSVPAILLVAACAPSADPCAAASDKLATCFPDQATIAPTCDPAIASEIAESSCDELAARDGKADGWTCVWMPWLCTGGGGASRETIEVSLETCGPGALCPYVTGASCGLVTLHDDDGREVSRGYTRTGGRFTFTGLPDGEYTVKAHERDGSLATMLPDALSSSTASAKLSVTVGAWARFSLTPSSGAQVDQCAVLDGGLTVRAASGDTVDAHDVEWEWIVELEQDGDILDRTRPLYIHPGRNVLSFREVRPGSYTLRFVRVDIPSYARRPNPSYDELRAAYAVDVEPVEVELRITNAQRGQTVAITRTITDPLR